MNIDERNDTVKTDCEPNLTIINTNARSLCPKIDSLLDCMQEMEAKIAVVMETWMRGGEGLEGRKEDLELGAGVGMICRNRRIADNGVAYGGVAVVWRTGSCSMKEVGIGHSDHEVLVVAGKIKGSSRRMVVIACYLPPNIGVVRAGECLEFIYDCVLEVKRKFSDPFIAVAGDFNQWKISDALADYNDIKEAQVGNTRGSRSIDKIFVNFSRSIVCLLYTSPSPRDRQKSRMPSSA